LILARIPAFYRLETVGICLVVLLNKIALGYIILLSLGCYIDARNCMRAGQTRQLPDPT
jgi:hypothetical protein